MTNTNVSFQDDVFKLYMLIKISRDSAFRTHVIEYFAETVIESLLIHGIETRSSFYVSFPNQESLYTAKVLFMSLTL